MTSDGEADAIKDFTRVLRENACGDEGCERTRVNAALLVLHGGKEHTDYARLVLGAQGERLGGE